MRRRSEGREGSGETGTMTPPPAGEYLPAVVAHHIGIDGESMLPLVTDIVAAYTARTQGDSPSWTPAASAIRRLRDLAARGPPGPADDAESVIGRQLGYWKDKLAGLPDVLDLPADRPRPLVASYRGADFWLRVPRRRVGAVREIARRYGVTEFMVVHAVLAVLLARLSASQDIAVSTPTAGRGQAVLDRLVGMFVNTLVLRADVPSSMSFEELLDQVRLSDLDAFEHADVPFESVVEAVDPVRSEAFAPLAQVMLSFNRRHRSPTPTSRSVICRSLQWSRTGSRQTGSVRDRKSSAMPAIRGPV